MSPTPHVLGVLAAGDPAADRVVYGIVIALVLVGVVLIGIGVWLFRQTRVDPELLAPLERMNDRSWSRRDPATQRRMLDEVRPDGAVPLHREPKEPEPDEEFEQVDRPVESFDDLKEPRPETEVEADVGEDSEVEVDDDAGVGGEEDADAGPGEAAESEDGGTENVIPETGGSGPGGSEAEGAVDEASEAGVEEDDEPEGEASDGAGLGDTTDRDDEAGRDEPEADGAAEEPGDDEPGMDEQSDEPEPRDEERAGEMLPAGGTTEE